MGGGRVSVVFSLLVLLGILTKGSHECSPFKQYECDNGACIDISLKCNADDDCGDDSDEIHCGNTDDRSQTQVTCSRAFFPCLDGTQCIRKSFLCDGEPECTDSSDEYICAPDPQTICNPYDFRCATGECVPKDFVLDGHIDCKDASDEIEVAKHCHVRDGKFLCDHARQCISMEQVCDNQTLCSDGSDEGGLCGSQCHDRNCSHICHETPLGGLCTCPNGYRMESDGLTCSDMDECSWDWVPACDQLCTNTEGSFSCSCKPGYRLLDDTKTCELQGKESTSLVFWDDTSIKVYDLSKKNLTTLVTHQLSINTTAVGPDMTIYWTNTEEGKVYQSTIQSYSAKVKVSRGLSAPTGLAIDWLTSNLYIIDLQQQVIFACKGDNCIEIINDLKVPHDVIVDPNSKKLLWTDWGLTSDGGVIGQSWMDGSEKFDLKQGLTRPRSLTLDVTLDCLFYVIERRSHLVVEMIKMDGSGMRDVTGGNTHPFGIDVLAGLLYWSDVEVWSILSSDKLEPTKPKVLLGNLTHARGVRVYHPVRFIKEHDNPCSKANCSFLCVLSNSIHGYKCRCPMGMELNTNGYNCQERKTNVTIYTSGTEGILQIQFPPLEGAGGQGKLLLQTDADVLAVDPVTNLIIYYDVAKRMIAALYHVGSKNRSIEFSPLYHDVSTVEGLAVDWDAGNIYWTSTEGKIYRADVSGQGGVEVLRQEGLDKPRGILLDIALGELYFTDWGVAPCIQRCSLQATNCKVMVSAPDVSHPNALAISYTKLTNDKYSRSLYWTDSKTKAIGYIDLDGKPTDLHVTLIPIEHDKAFPFSLTVSMDTVFFTDWNTNKIYYFPMSNTSAISSISVERKSLYSLAAVDTRLSFSKDLTIIMYAACYHNNGGCSHICEVDSEGQRLCQCSKGWSLLADQVTCSNTSRTDKITSRSTAATEEQVWLVGVLLGAVLIIGLAILVAIVVIRRKRAGQKLLQIIKYRNSYPTDEEEELVPNIVLTESEFQNFDDLDYPTTRNDSSQISEDSALPDVGNSSYSGQSSRSSDSFDV